MSVPAILRHGILTFMVGLGALVVIINSIRRMLGIAPGRSIARQTIVATVHETVARALFEGSERRDEDQ